MVSIKVLYPQKERALTELAAGTRLERDLYMLVGRVAIHKNHNERIS